MQQALVVEDDHDLARALTLALSREGLKVSWVDNLEDTRGLIKKNEFTLAIIDRVLPDGDGITLVEDFASLSYQTKVLILSSKSSYLEKNLGLRSGADDYLSKPFNYQELILRIKKLLAKQKIYSPRVLSCHGITLFPNTGQLIVGEKQSKIRPREAQILSCLIYHQHLAVTDQVLIDFVWGNEGKTPLHSSLSVYIRRLRIALGSESKRLKTIRGIGYCLS